MNKHDLIHVPYKCYGKDTDTFYDWIKRSIYDDEIVEWFAETMAAARELSGAYADVLLKTGEPLDEDIESIVSGMHFGYFEHPSWRKLMEREYR